MFLLDNSAVIGFLNTIFYVQNPQKRTTIPLIIVPLYIFYYIYAPISTSLLVALRFPQFHGLQKRSGPVKFALPGQTPSFISFDLFRQFPLYRSIYLVFS